MTLIKRISHQHTKTFDNLLGGHFDRVTFQSNNMLGCSIKFNEKDCFTKQLICLLDGEVIWEASETPFNKRGPPQRIRLFNRKTFANSLMCFLNEPSSVNWQISHETSQKYARHVEEHGVL